MGARLRVFLTGEQDHTLDISEKCQEPRSGLGRHLMTRQTTVKRCDLVFFRSNWLLLRRSQIRIYSRELLYPLIYRTTLHYTAPLITVDGLPVENLPDGWSVFVAQRRYEQEIEKFTAVFTLYDPHRLSGRTAVRPNDCVLCT